MGPQGAGKGTQAQMLAKEFSLPIIATGEILREVAKEDTELGRHVREEQAAGHLVSDEILGEIVSQRTVLEDCKNGYILDGFPRTLPQARLLDQIAEAEGCRTVVITIDVPPDLLYKRLAGRRTCSKCNTVYNVFFKPPQKEGVCDLDGAPLFTRSDDNEEAIAKRLTLNTEKTQPLLDYYEASGRLHRVDGTGAPEEVFERIARIVRQEACQGA